MKNLIRGPRSKSGTFIDDLQSKNLNFANLTYYDNSEFLKELENTPVNKQKYKLYDGKIIENIKVRQTMKKLSTIQTRENLNEVYSVGEKSNGANHKYLIACKSDNGDREPSVYKIQFQHGARRELGSIDGVLDSDLLEVVRHRLQCFQKNLRTNNKYNARALEHVEVALMYLNRRVENRIERNVLGTNNK